jgi:hypothetical protein
VIPGYYQVYVTHTAKDSRPLRLSIGEAVAIASFASEVTGTWAATGRQQFSAGEIKIASDSPTITVRNLGGSWPHVKELRLVYKRDL